MKITLITISRCRKPAADVAFQAYLARQSKPHWSIFLFMLFFGRGFVGCGGSIDVVGVLIGQATTPSTSRLNLQVWNPGAPQGDKEYRFAARITNWGENPVRVNRLSIGYWFYYRESPPLEIKSYDKNQALYTAKGTWKTNLVAPVASIQDLANPRECGLTRKATKVVIIGFNEEKKLMIDPRGGYLETSTDTNTLAIWNRSDWEPFDFSQDYSRITEAGNSSMTRKDLQYFTLYLDGVLVLEYLNQNAGDPNSGIEPCP